MTDNLVKVSGIVPAELHAEIRVWAINNREKMQDIIHQALAEFRDKHISKKTKVAV